MWTGGDMIQVRAYERALRDQGYNAQYEFNSSLDISKYDMVWLFHINFSWTWEHYHNCLKYKKPYCVFTVFYPFEVGDMPKQRMIEILAKAEHIFCLSTTEGREMNAFLEHDFSFIPINNGVDKKIFYPAQKIEDSFVISAGRWEQLKGHARVIEACRDLNIPVVVIGGMGNMDYYNYCRGLWDKANCLMEIDQNQLADYYRQARVCVCASESERNNLTLLEAAACGCGIVASIYNRGNEWFPQDLSTTDLHPENLKEQIKQEWDNPSNYSQLILNWEDVINNVLGEL